MPEQDTAKPYPDGVGAIFEIARRLRAPDGCPWDREQTHESLRPYLLEETYELLEAIDRGDDDGKLLEELGDVLLQVAMHAAIAEEQGRFDAARVSEAAAAKMVARHPHVFGDTEVSSAEEVLRNWEHQKAAEAARAGNGDQTVLDRVPPTLPALAWTLNMQKRAARVGFDLDSAADARARVAEEAGEAATFDAVGDLLLDVVGLARMLRINPEDALRAAGRRYRDRFVRMDRELTARGGSYRDLDRAEQLELWDRAR
ncbi:MAG TPA: nucleoside triphosphate pyrophosphohydrolase [Candidatus Binatia bacterium]|nr:nucleoside triphosphate pyrophosphohydrolase [Candidatus Binatia bacterium]